MSEPSRPNVRKVVIQMLAGGVFGAAASLAVARWFPQLDDAVSPGGAALAGVGVVYAFMGLFVGLGVAFPGLGARMLNVADIDDLADQRALLAGSAVCCTALGLAMMLVAISEPLGPVPGTLAVAALALSMVVAAAITIVQWHLYDELWRGISMEASAVTLGIVFPIVTIWAALAHIGSAAPIDPLGLIALLAAAMLLASFVAAGRRGLLVPQ